MIKYNRDKKKLVIPNGLGNYTQLIDKAYWEGYHQGLNDAKNNTKNVEE